MPYDKERQAEYKRDYNARKAAQTEDGDKKELEDAGLRERKYRHQGLSSDDRMNLAELRDKRAPHGLRKRAIELRQDPNNKRR